MNRIDEKFIELQEVNKTAFIGYVTLGDPNTEISIQLVKEMANCGCDIIELGLPFSDPIAEGPVIQAANLRALENGMNTSKAMEIVKEIRKNVNLPLVYLLYYNQIFKYGIERFFVESKDAGIDGVIIADLPYEHVFEVEEIAAKYDIHIISLVTTVSKDRKEMIARKSKGFLYCVTSVGVTGQRDLIDVNLRPFIDELNTYTNTPKALGFGISTVAQIKKMKQYADGIIVGSAIVDVVKDISLNKKSIEDFKKYITELAKACHD